MTLLGGLPFKQVLQDPSIKTFAKLSLLNLRGVLALVPHAAPTSSVPNTPIYVKLVGPLPQQLKLSTKTIKKGKAKE